MIGGSVAKDNTSATRAMLELGIKGASVIEKVMEDRERIGANKGHGGTEATRSMMSQLGGPPASEGGGGGGGGAEEEGGAAEQQQRRHHQGQSERQHQAQQHGIDA